METFDWQEIHLSEDEASAQGTRAVRFLVQQVEKAQKNPYLKPILNNLMMAHALRLGIYEPNMEFLPRVKSQVKVLEEMHLFQEVDVKVILKMMFSQDVQVHLLLN